MKNFVQRAPKKLRTARSSDVVVGPRIDRSIWWTVEGVHRNTSELHQSQCHICRSGANSTCPLSTRAGCHFQKMCLRCHKLLIYSHGSMLSPSLCILQTFIQGNFKLAHYIFAVFLPKFHWPTALPDSSCFSFVTAFYSSKTVYNDRRPSALRRSNIILHSIFYFSLLYAFCNIFLSVLHAQCHDCSPRLFVHIMK